MNSLYEIDQTILNLIEKGFTDDCIDIETGEIDEDKVREYLESLPVEREKKFEAYGCLIKNLTSEALAIKEEEKKLAERRQSKEKTIERLKDAISVSMQKLGNSKFETAKVVFSFRKSEVVEIENIDDLPEEYLTIKTTTSADKVALKQALKDGQVINGVSLVEKQNLQIK